ncbi:MAG: rod-binding protein [Alphaproteobacteria bacterium]
MIDAGLIAQNIVRQQDRAAESTMRQARTSLLEDKARALNDQQAQKAAEDFEALFISQMLTHMFGESLGNEFFGSEETSEIYRGLMADEYAKKLTQSGGIGVADYVKKELLKLQEVSS